MEKGKIYPIENVQFVGTSGFCHTYDFALQQTRYNPERICLAVNNSNKSSAGNIIFSWNDTKPVRKAESQLVVLLNDSNTIGKDTENAFLAYGIKPIRWSERETSQNLSLLTA